MIKRFFCTALYTLLLIFLSACRLDSSVPPGRIRIKNDFWGKEDSTIQVSGGGASYTLESGQSVLLPRGTSDITFSYTSKAKGTRQWGVRCPSRLEDGISIKLIDVTMGRIAGGCEKTWFDQK
jgi:hypothetical protein